MAVNVLILPYIFKYRCNTSCTESLPRHINASSLVSFYANMRLAQYIPTWQCINCYSSLTRENKLEDIQIRKLH